MALNFPDNPSLNATYTAPGGSTYVWDGAKWNISNSLPPMGGTGADAWLKCNGSGTINGSFNIASVTKSNTGTYDVVFTTPMPSGDYAIVGGTNGNSTRIVRCQNISSTGFTVQVRNINNALQDSNFSVIVHASNAILPTPITEDSLLFTDGRNDATSVQAFDAGVQLGDSGTTIDDYEEGTFTANLASTGNVNGSMASGTGHYTKIGRVVRITVKIYSNGTQTAGHSGDVIITGLPFTGGSTSIEQIAAPITHNGVHGKYVMALDFPGTTPYLVVHNTAVQGDHTALFPNGANVRYYFSLSYTIYD